ncbi:hypothetical protein QJS66_04580 [Kocuria rhizophila]|nr:hypothetical protein QJS66_04580 [Kocuria rhizophila]
MAHSPSPKAQLDLLRRLEDLLGLSLPSILLIEDAEAWERGVDELASEDPEVADGREQLEEAEGTPWTSRRLPGDAIAREFERYLLPRRAGPQTSPPGRLRACTAAPRRCPRQTRLSTTPHGPCWRLHPRNRAAHASTAISVAGALRPPPSATHGREHGVRTRRLRLGSRLAPRG